jgi:hypothetical protein
MLVKLTPEAKKMQDYSIHSLWSDQSLHLAISRLIEALKNKIKRTKP